MKGKSSIGVLVLIFVVIGVIMYKPHLKPEEGEKDGVSLKVNYYDSDMNMIASSDRSEPTMLDKIVDILKGLGGFYVSELPPDKVCQSVSSNSPCSDWLCNAPYCQVRLIAIGDVCDCDTFIDYTGPAYEDGETIPADDFNCGVLWRCIGRFYNAVCDLGDLKCQGNEKWACSNNAWHYVSTCPVGTVCVQTDEYTLECQLEAATTTTPGATTTLPELERQPGDYCVDDSQCASGICTMDAVAITTTTPLTTTTPVTTTLPIVGCVGSPPPECLSKYGNLNTCTCPECNFLYDVNHEGDIVIVYVGETMNIGDAIAPVASHIQLIRYYDGSNWYIYDPATMTGTLGTLTNGECYKFSVNPGGPWYWPAQTVCPTVDGMSDVCYIKFNVDAYNDGEIDLNLYIEDASPSVLLSAFSGASPGVAQPGGGKLWISDLISTEQFVGLTQPATFWVEVGGSYEQSPGVIVTKFASDDTSIFFGDPGATITMNVGVYYIWHYADDYDSNWQSKVNNALPQAFSYLESYNPNIQWVHTILGEAQVSYIVGHGTNIMTHIPWKVMTSIMMELETIDTNFKSNYNSYNMIIFIFANTEGAYVMPENDPNEDYGVRGKSPVFFGAQHLVDYHPVVGVTWTPRISFSHEILHTFNIPHDEVIDGKCIMTVVSNEYSLLGLSDSYYISDDAYLCSVASDRFYTVNYRKNAFEYITYDWSRVG